MNQLILLIVWNGFSLSDVHLDDDFIYCNEAQLVKVFIFTRVQEFLCNSQYPGKYCLWYFVRRRYVVEQMEVELNEKRDWDRAKENRMTEEEWERFE